MSSGLLLVTGRQDLLTISSGQREERCQVRSFLSGGAGQGDMGEDSDC